MTTLSKHIKLRMAFTTSKLNLKSVRLCEDDHTEDVSGYHILGFPALAFPQQCMPTIVAILIAAYMQATFATLTKAKTKFWIKIHIIPKS